MTSIWDFLLYTLTVSVTACLLLLIKRLFQDKLSPRWQYGIWILLALRLMLPVIASRSLLPPLPLWIEIAKSRAESALAQGHASAYASTWLPVHSGIPLPVLSPRPVSLTDWFFVLYAAGFVTFLLMYLASWLRLRCLLSHSRPVTSDQAAQIAAVSSQFGLNACKAVTVEGLTSAFICGVFRPVLALPADRPVDDKVILHELLHLQSRDGLQNIFWSFFRALHWCNPFLHYVFNRIGNDMESLCDQRVLERLEGEERRQYGVILLSMANEKYPRAAGTTSLSNGSANIARRIDAIVRFKKYPRGMALVSVCIVIMLAYPCLIGPEASLYAEAAEENTGTSAVSLSIFPETDYRQVSSAGEFSAAMASTRLYRCTTPAGALDTFAKGILSGNGLYLASAMPLACQEQLCARMAADGAALKEAAPHAASWVEDSSGRWVQADTCWYLNYPLGGTLSETSYAIYNPEQLTEDTYRVYLVFPLSSLEEGVSCRRTPASDYINPAVENGEAEPVL